MVDKPPHQNPRRFGKVVLPIVVIALSLSLAGTLQRHIDSFRNKDTINEVLYFPNDKFLKHFTAGLSNVLADFMWYKTVQYTSKEFNSDEARFTWLEHMIRATNRLDPYYADPYIYGGLFLSSIRADDAAEEILKEGLVNCPTSWRIPYELHSLYLMNKRHEPGAQQMASHYALLVAERQEGKMQEDYIKLANDLLLKENMVDEAVEFFTRAVQTAEDPLIRQHLEAQLRIAIIEKNVVVLNEAADGYLQEKGRPITSLEELVQEGYINALPDAPDDGDYLLRKDGVVINTVAVEPIINYVLGALRKKIEIFHGEHKRYPVSLEELWPEFVSSGPKHPIPGRDWIYDAESGTVK